MNAIRVEALTLLAVLLFALPNQGGEPPKAPPSPKVGEALYGDPLPKGVIVRLGSVRSRLPQAVWEVSFSPDGRVAATSSWMRLESVVRLWDTRTGWLLRSLEADSGSVTDVAFSPDGQTLATSHWLHWKDRTKVRIWNVRTGRERYALTGDMRNCLCVAFSPDGKRLAAGDDYYDSKGAPGGRLCIWDAAAGKLIREIRTTRGSIQRLLFTPDGRHILAAANGVHIYDADSGRLLDKPFQANTRVWRMALSADGRLLATADGLGGPVRLWELATCREIPLAIPGGDGMGVALTPDGRTLAASNSKRGVVIFHWPSGKTIGKLSGDVYIGICVFLSPDGLRLATADKDKSTALIWDVADLVNRPLPAVAKPTDADLRRWWSELGDAKPATAYKAVWSFAAVPEQARPFLAASLPPIKHAQPARVARLIAELDSDEFQVREGASRDLSQLGEAVVDALHKAKKGNLSAEQAQRINRLLAQHASPEPGTEQLRAIRTIVILEQTGGPDAQKVLMKLAAGATGARLTREAQAALGRLKRNIPLGAARKRP